MAMQILIRILQLPRELNTKDVRQGCMQVPSRRPFITLVSGTAMAYLCAAVGIFVTSKHYWVLVGGLLPECNVLLTSCTYSTQTLPVVWAAASTLFARIMQGLSGGSELDVPPF